MEFIMNFCCFTFWTRSVGFYKRILFQWYYIHITPALCFSSCSSDMTMAA